MLFLLDDPPNISLMRVDADVVYMYGNIML